MSPAAIGYTVARTRLGSMLVAGTRRGVCHVAFGRNEPEVLARLRSRFPYATPGREDARLSGWAERLCDYVDGRSIRIDVPLDVGGTRFQREVWSALRRIPRGRTRTYGEIARDVGRARGARAVARACASNPVAVAIPCHRVVPAAGGPGGYAFGVARKRALLEAEGVDPSCQR